MSIHRAQVTGLGGPLIPDRDAVVFQILSIGVPVQKPQQLVNDRTQMAFFGGDQGKARAQVETHLIAKHTHGARSGTIFLAGAMLFDMAHQIQILLHL